MPEPTIDTPPPIRDGDAINAEATRLETGIYNKFKSMMAEVPPVAPQTPVPPAPAVPTQVPVATPTPTAVSAPVAAPDEFATLPIEERPPETMSKAGKESWAKFHALKNSQLEKERTERQTLVRQLEELKKSGGVSPELEVLRQEKIKLEAALEKVSLAESPRFRQYYEGGIEKQRAIIREAAGAHADEVLQLLDQSGPARNKRLAEIVDELGFEGAAISTAAFQIRSLRQERDKQLAASSDNLKLLRAHEAQEAAERSTRESAQRTAMTETILARARELPEFKPAATDAAHTAFASTALEVIRQASLGKLSQEDSLMLPVAAMKAQYYEQFRIPALQSEIKALQDRVTSLNSSTPRVEGGQAPGQAPGLPTTTESATADIMRKFREKMGGA